jgi:hypothetical protein
MDQFDKAQMVRVLREAPRGSTRCGPVGFCQPASKRLECGYPARYCAFMVFMSMRSICVAAAGGVAIGVLVIAPVVLMGGPSAHADTGIDGYVRCLGGDAKPPPPGVSAENWFPSVHVIATDFDSGVPPAQIAQILVGMGVKPDDAARRVSCFVATQPRGEGH